MSTQTLPATNDSIYEPKPIVHTERYFTSAGGAQYVLPSDDVERERLALQHRILKKVFGGKLILPPVDFTSGSAILDSGTGSGTWILDVAENMSAAVNLHGTDIEPHLFPALDGVSCSNVQFSINSITDLPKDWDNTFTLVNQRLLMAALDRTGWQTALREIRRVLVPGGWVQLGEGCTWKNVGPISDRRHRALLGALFEANGMLVDCGLHIPSMLEEAGFQDIHVEKRSIRVGQWAGQDGIDARNNLAAVFRAMKTPTLKAGGFGYISSEYEFDALMDGVEKEWDEFPGTEWRFDYIYARKPIGS